MENIDQQWVCVGQFGGSYAVQGWVKLQSFTEPDEAIFTYQPWYVEKKYTENSKLAGNAESGSGNTVAADKKPQHQKLQLSASRRHGRAFVVKLVGIDSPEQAQRLAGCSIYIERENLPPLAPGQYYWIDLIGLAVENQAGRQLGYVSEMMETGANDVMVVKALSGDEILIPYVFDHYIMAIDLAARKIVVDWDWDD